MKFLEPNEVSAPEIEIWQDMLNKHINNMKMKKRTFKIADFWLSTFEAFSKVFFMKKTELRVIRRVVKRMTGILVESLEYRGEILTQFNVFLERLLSPLSSCGLVRSCHLVLTSSVTTILVFSLLNENGYGYAVFVIKSRSFAVDFY